MSNKPLTQEAATSMYSMVNIYGDGWEFHGPAFLAWRIRTYLTAISKGAVGEGSVVKNAVQMNAMGKDGQTLARQIMDDEWHCGNEPRWPIPHPHWTDQLVELALYADALPAASPLRKSALQLAQGMLNKAQEAG
jgi:hypothetical protein